MKLAALCAFCAVTFSSAIGVAESGSGRGTPLHIDASAGVLFRTASENGTTAMFGGDHRVGGSLRGAWWAYSTETRLGLWLGYRFEPGHVATMFADSGSNGGVRTWLLAHDISIGPAFNQTLFGTDGDYPRCCAMFVRGYAGGGLTFSTLQAESRDDGHVYSDSSVGWNLTGTGDVGVRVSGSFEIFVGAGYFWTEKKGLGLKLQQPDTTLASLPTTLAYVQRVGIITYLGVGFEF
jgi:hypothetical protein